MNRTPSSHPSPPLGEKVPGGRVRGGSNLDRLFWICSLSLFLCGCAGYRLGPTNGQAAGSKTIQINFFQNETMEPRLIEPVASAIRKSIQRDGTYRLNTRNQGDIVVDGIITSYDRTGLSFNPRDILTPRDFQVRLSAKVTAIDRNTGKTILNREVFGRTTLRTGVDLASAERQAVPLLADDLAKNVTSLLVDGIW
jgi:hypothetical protein